MLQKIDKDRLDKVLQVLKDHKIRFPVAEVVKRLGADKGMVSAYLNGKKPISDKFYSTFMKSFNQPIKQTSPEIIDTTEQTILKLAESNKQLALAFSHQADAQLFQSKAWLVQAEASKILAETNNGLMQKIPNSNPTQPNVSEILLPWINRVAVNGVGSIWETKEAGFAILDKLLVGAVMEKQQ
jgi:hypothetical protein